MSATSVSRSTVHLPVATPSYCLRHPVGRVNGALSATRGFPGHRLIGFSDTMVGRISVHRVMVERSEEMNEEAVA